MSILRLTASLCLGAMGNAYMHSFPTASCFQQASQPHHGSDAAVLPSLSALDDCSPSSSSSSSLQHGGGSSNSHCTVSHCMEELDRRGPSAWVIETSDFSPAAMVANVRKGKPCFQILRQAEPYTAAPLNADVTDADAAAVVSPSSSAPYLRLIGFFPGIESDRVLAHMTEVEKRLKWDVNYQLFRPYGGDDVVSGGAPPPPTRPMRLVANRRPQCANGECKLVPDTTSSLVARQWMCHRVGSNMLAKLGLLPRLFVYERYVWAHEPTVFPASDAEAGHHAADVKKEGASLYDVLYVGARDAVAQACRRSSRLQAWLDDPLVASVPSVPVHMNYQHLLLIPIADYKQQMLEQPERLESLARSGSMADEASTQQIYRIYKESLALAAAKSGQQEGNEEAKDCALGTLMIMTSANDAGSPKHIPRFVEKRLAEAISRQAYGELMKALLEEKSKNKL